MLVVTVVGIAYAVQRVGDKWIRRLERREVGGIQEGRFKELAEYLKRPRIIDGCESNHLVWEFIWIT